MQEFHRRGHECELIDYREDTLPCARRIGSTEADIPRGAKYDLIVCSHVIEHLADPKGVLTKLVEHLDGGGGLFIEVPMEIWRKAPPRQEPETHLNFFTRSSPQRLCEEVGLASSPSLGGYRAGAGWALCIRAVGRRGTGKRRASHGPAEARRYLTPGISLKLKRRLLMPHTISGALRHQLSRLAARG
jgi:SAM-dependent methyltransferase